MKRAASGVEPGPVSGGATEKECNSFFPKSVADVSWFLPRTSLHVKLERVAAARRLVREAEADTGPGGRPGRAKPDGKSRLGKHKGVSQ
jgi:hypothetical protein